MIFDLDGTIWKYKSGFEEVKNINPIIPNLFDNLKKDYYIAIASLTPHPNYSFKKLSQYINIPNTIDYIYMEGYYNETFCVKNRMTYLQIEKTFDKTNHFENIKNELDIPYKYITMYDDEINNIMKGIECGMKSVYVPNGINNMDDL